MAQAPTTWFGGRLKFNDEVFGKYINALPPTKTYKFINSGIVTQDGTLSQYFSSQTGSYSQRIPMYGLADSTESNYDGETPMGDPGYQDSYSAATVAYGRQFAVAEKDFSYDLIPGADFASVLRKSIVKIRDDAFEKRIFGITDALFGVTDKPENGFTEGSPEAEFVEKHTFDISAKADGENKIGDTTLNNALQQACGEFKSDFSMIAMHSQVATNLENLKLIQYAKGVDGNGVIKDLGFGTWNGKTVVIDDRMPFDEELGEYTTYCYGKGIFGYTNIPVVTPYEPKRDQELAIDMIYTRYREVIAPRGWSFEGRTETMSPTDKELFTPANWKLADNGKSGDERKTYPIQRIPLVRIKSLG